MADLYNHGKKLFNFIYIFRLFLTLFWTTGIIVKLFNIADSQDRLYIGLSSKFENLIKDILYYSFLSFGLIHLWIYQYRLKELKEWILPLSNYFKERKIDIPKFVENTNSLRDLISFFKFELIAFLIAFYFLNDGNIAIIHLLLLIFSSVSNFFIYNIFQEIIDISKIWVKRLELTSLPSIDFLYKLGGLKKILYYSKNIIILFIVILIIDIKNNDLSNFFIIAILLTSMFCLYQLSLNFLDKFIQKINSKEVIVDYHEG